MPGLKTRELGGHRKPWKAQFPSWLLSRGHSHLRPGKAVRTQACLSSHCTLPLPAPVQGAPKEVVDPSSGRATLLESIRQAGGIGKAKLRSVKERKLEKKKQKEQEQGKETLGLSQ